MCITNAGIVIRTPLEQIRICGRNTSGVKIMNLEGRQRVVSVAIVPHEDQVDESEVEAEPEIVEDEVSSSDTFADTALPSNDEE